jgi:hypothetical protein
LEDEKDGKGVSDRIVDIYQNEVHAAYSRVPFGAVLAVESSFKLARYLVGIGRRSHATEMLFRAYQLRTECGPHDQVVLTVEAALMCDQLGYHRKFG